MGNIERCDMCGSFDDHPKAHIGDAFGAGLIRTYHLDCLPVDDRNELAADPNFGQLNAAAIDAARSGTQGDDLRAVIVAQQPQRDEILAAAAPAEPSAPVSEGN